MSLAAENANYGIALVDVAARSSALRDFHVDAALCRAYLHLVHSLALTASPFVTASSRQQGSLSHHKPRKRQWPVELASGSTWLAVEVTEVTGECFHAGSWRVSTCLADSRASPFLPVNSVSLATRCRSEILRSSAASSNCCHVELVLMCFFFPLPFLPLLLLLLLF